MAAPPCSRSANLRSTMPLPRTVPSSWLGTNSNSNSNSNHRHIFISSFVFFLGRFLFKFNMNEDIKDLVRPFYIETKGVC